VACEAAGPAGNSPAEVQSCFPERLSASAQFRGAVRITDEGKLWREALESPPVGGPAVSGPMIALFPERGVCCWDLVGLPADAVIEASELLLLVELAPGTRLRVHITLSCSVAHATGDEELLEYALEKTL
jgi:hypothetical protein